MPFIFGVVGAAAQGTRRSSGGGGVGYGTVTGYYNNINYSKFCANIGNTSITAYYSGSGTKTFSQVYSLGLTIFSNTALTTSASSGIYGDQNGGIGNDWFEWQSGGGWISTGRCRS